MVGVSVAYNFQTGSNKIKLPTEYESVTPTLGPYFREFLDMHFPGRCVGRDGPIPWPPHSLDIMPLDFFLWGYIKD
jgi:hypothetical protein